MEAFGFKLWRLLIANGPLYRLALRFAHLLQKPFVGENRMINSMIGPAGKWTRDRDLPPLAREPFSRRWKKQHSKKEGANSGVSNG
jgi:L-lactate dehydrogenase complex protein LldF